MTRGELGPTRREAAPPALPPCSTTAARTADLVRKLTALADRYDRAIQDGDVGAADRRRRVALLRGAAEAGRRLIPALAPSAPPLGEQPGIPGRGDATADPDVPVCRRDAAAEASSTKAPRPWGLSRR